MNDRAKEFEKVIFGFAVEIVTLANELIEKRHDWVLSRQIMRSATSIGANYREAQYAQTKPDFVAKVSVSLKEAGETQYWLDLLLATKYISESQHHHLRETDDRIISSLVRIVKTAKTSDNRKPVTT